MPVETMLLYDNDGLVFPFSLRKNPCAPLPLSPSGIARYHWSSFDVAAPKIWNSLPPTLQMYTSLTSFFVISRLFIPNRPSNSFNTVLLARQIHLLLTTVRSFVRYCGQGSGLLCTPEQRPSV